ncbi:dentin matrix acidic phosphoprotein 1 isoform X3 [Grus americana]|uniref:dentin matrix acidic phosphoprotein 1 isoform X3 n=1 Tax=Grus americana TaxID=9117 RepID=UPI0024082059|nr:dentin matrix acidic phosphoprotein 1 isoform X3 [Grus americana]
MWRTPLPSACVKKMPSLGRGLVLSVGNAIVVCVCHSGKCVNRINLAVKTQGQRSRSLTASPSRHPATTRSFFRAGAPAEARGSVGGQFPVTPPRTAALPAGVIGCPLPRAGTSQRLNARTATPGAHSPGHPNTGSQLAPSRAPEQTLASTTPQASGTTTDMRTAFLVLLLWAIACAHPEEDARDADDGDNREHHGTGVNGLPFRDGGLLDEEDDSGDDTFDENGEKEEGEGPTYVAGADESGKHGYDAGRGDAGAGRGHGDSSSSSSSESIGVEHRRYRNYLGSRYERTYKWGGGSSSSQEEESYDFEDEAMQGDDPSVFDGPGSSYKGHRAWPRTARSSRESSRGVGSHQWEEGDSRSPEVEDTDSGEDSPSVEDNSQSEEPVTSQSEENSASRSREDGEDSPSREGEDSKSREGTADQSDEEPGESPEDNSQEVVSTSSGRSGSQSQEGQEDRQSAEDRSAPSAPDSESGEDEGDQSKSREDDGNQSQSTEDTVEESKEDENDSDPYGDVPSTSAESQSASPEDDGSQEDNAGEDSRSTESNNSESQEDEDNEESHSQEDATHESSSRGDDSSPQSLESGSRKRRLGAYRNKPAADYDDNDCQDGY